MGLPTGESQQVQQRAVEGIQTHMISGIINTAIDRKDLWTWPQNVFAHMLVYTHTHTKHVHIIFKAEKMVHSWVVSGLLGTRHPNPPPQPWPEESAATHFLSSLIFSSFPTHTGILSYPDASSHFLEALGLDLTMSGHFSSHSSLSTNILPPNRLFRVPISNSPLPVMLQPLECAAFSVADTTWCGALVCSIKGP